MSLVLGKRIGIDCGDADCAMRDLASHSGSSPEICTPRDKRRWLGQVLISIMRHSIVFLGNLTSFKAAARS
jgi:hypothetical protein